MFICYFMTLINPRELYCTHSVFSLLPSAMSIQFKFRSSVNFDSIDIGREGLSSISLKDLRSRIALHKNLNLSGDFDLVISDARTGQVLDDDELQIPTGTRIIIKRVPAGSARDPPAPVELFKSSGVQTKKQEDTFKPLPVGVVVENFDDFGDDICPANELVFLDSDLYSGRVDSFSDEKKNIPGCAGLKFGANDESEADPIGIMHDGIAQNLAPSKLRSRAEKLINQDKLEIVIPPPVRDSDFPVELKCSLCHTYFKEAVMIPCCQHSFCDKCIRSVLVERARCPKCSSTKCRVEDLLPNLSLRQAIEHFRGSQILHNDSENNLPQYAPDGESRIQGKDVSCTMSTFRREPDLAHSPSASGNGSNQITAEPICEPRSRKKVAVSASPMNAAAGKSLELAPIVHTKQVVSAIKEPKVSWHNVADEYRRFAGISGQKKSERTCYKCGSPDHLIRDCPAAHGLPPMHFTGDAMFSRAMPGYAPPFWTGTPLPYTQPFAFYGNQGMMPYNATLVHVNPFAFPSCAPSVYGALPASSGFMRTGGPVPPVAADGDNPIHHAEFLELQDSERRQKRLHENLGRGRSFDNADKYEQNQFTEPEDIPSSSSEHGKGRNRHHRTFKRFNEGKEHPGSDSSWSRRYDKREKEDKRKSAEVKEHLGSDSARSHHHDKMKKSDTRKRCECDFERHDGRHHSNLEFLQTGHSTDQTKQYKEKDISHGSRHSRYSAKYNDDEVNHEKWQTIAGSANSFEKDYHRHKQKRDR